jgi:hypothetical protein
LKRLIWAFGIGLGVFAPLFLVAPAYADGCVSSQQSETIDAATDVSATVIRSIETCGGDDTSYRVPLTVSVSFDGHQYDSVYATTNSVITFGAPDNTYWTYPNTPSISLYSMDWVVFPWWHTDEHLIISASDGGFQIDIAARPYGNMNAPEVTNIVIVAAINVDGTVAISYSATGPTYDGATRTGVRLISGDVVTLEQYGVVHVETPPVLTPEPVVEPTPTPSPTPEPTPEPSPTPTPEPSPTITPEPIPSPQPTPEPVSPPEPAPVPVEEPVVAPTPEPAPAPEPPAIPEPTPNPPSPIEPAPVPIALEPEIFPIPVAEPEPAPAEVMAQLAKEAKADDPVLPSELAAIPFIGDVAGQVLEAFNALGNVGADMTPEVRAKSEKVVIASVIVGNIATTATMAASAAASTATNVRRKE